MDNQIPATNVIENAQPTPVISTEQCQIVCYMSKQILFNRSKYAGVLFKRDFIAVFSGDTSSVAAIQV